MKSIRVLIHDPVPCLLIVLIPFKGGDSIDEYTYHQSPFTHLEDGMVREVLQNPVVGGSDIVGAVEFNSPPIIIHILSG